MRLRYHLSGSAPERFLGLQARPAEQGHSGGWPARRASPATIAQRPGCQEQPAGVPASYRLIRGQHDQPTLPYTIPGTLTRSESALCWPGYGGTAFPGGRQEECPPLLLTRSPGRPPGPGHNPPGKYVQAACQARAGADVGLSAETARGWAAAQAPTAAALLASQGAFPTCGARPLKESRSTWASSDRPCISSTYFPLWPPQW